MMLTQTQEVVIKKIEDYTGVYLSSYGSSPTMTVLSKGTMSYTTTANETRPSVVSLIKSTIKSAEKKNWDFGNLDSTNYKNFLFG